MRVLLAGGGTAGHINPAVAIAEYIKKKDPGSEFLFAGTPNGMEAALVPKAGFAFAPIKVKGFQRSLAPKDIIKNMEAIGLLATANSRARKIIKDFAPDVVIGTGGYVSGPIVRAASKMGIKTAIHEQNAFPGVTTKLLSKQVDKVFLAFEEGKKYLDPNCNITVVGNPVRESVMKKSKKQARQELSLDDRLCILSFGGSLGAEIVNQAAADLMQWHCNQGDINHIHGYGRLGKEIFPKMLKERDLDLHRYKRIDAREYIDNMDTCLAAADIVVCRAGAITLSELEVAGKASVLIPSPYVAENHQYHNAMVLQNHNAAIVIEEKSYKKQQLIDFINSIYIDRKRLEELSKNAYQLAIFDTCERIYDSIAQILTK
ncbi:MAG: UDP-N-acetylglucosamine--N-acetylmuramyl-(pentapeptide) pyrophosphoryl-undecaprenol [Oscillospiraceae bacterium]|jgi:UDP-N-acetylglucosamine--N-acetylmuramyl-(pentapeptide) pyrophosphoryl-undecaprenol N-acetylglucosamine transferase|nr:UDP-N-acetylglucosamine--N-acetylmuramyl-(pentapeptide) pyrophosphoryl-undecaprenol [Oscillospiraceae bacterium]